jgi:hypothetical protein
MRFTPEQMASLDQPGVFEQFDFFASVAEIQEEANCSLLESILECLRRYPDVDAESVGYALKTDGKLKDFKRQLMEEGIDLRLLKPGKIRLAPSTKPKKKTAGGKTPGRPKILKQVHISRKIGNDDPTFLEKLIVETATAHSGSISAKQVANGYINAVVALPTKQVALLKGRLEKLDFIVTGMREPSDG